MMGFPLFDWPLRDESCSCSLSETSRFCSTRGVAVSISPMSWYCTCGTAAEAADWSDARLMPRFCSVFDKPAEEMPAMLVEPVARFE